MIAGRDRLDVEAVSGKDLSFTHFRTGTPARRQVTFLENCVYRGKDTGLKVIIIINIKGGFR